jgi:hypothetical protein
MPRFAKGPSLSAGLLVNILTQSMSKQIEASQRLRDFIAPAFEALSVKVAPVQLDEITELVSGSMLGAGRFFHNPEHVIHVGSGGDAISALAAFFHDLVYFQVDQGVGINVARHIAVFAQEKDSGLYLRTDVPFNEYPFARPVMDIFGFSPGDFLPPNGGQNEFLSALAAGSVLAPLMNLSQIVQIAVCIEATIPFRNAVEGKLPTETLLERLRQVNGVYKLGLKETELRPMVRRAVRMANQDVSNFGGESATRFLKNTWELVPEINPLLRSPSSYTVEGYRGALEKMEHFFSHLDPAVIFQRFDDEPSAEQHRILLANANRRVEEARHYFRLKLISLGLLEALSGTLGRNLGLPVLMGELSNLGSPEDRVEKYLPVLDSINTRGDEMEIRLLRLLDKNVDQETETGLKSSPLTAFLVRSIGFRTLLQTWPKVQAYFADASTAKDFLGAFPIETVGQVSDAISILLQRRAHRLTTFVGSLTPKG